MLLLQSCILEYSINILHILGLQNINLSQKNDFTRSYLEQAKATDSIQIIAIDRKSYCCSKFLCFFYITVVCSTYTHKQNTSANTFLLDQPSCEYSAVCLYLCPRCSCSLHDYALQTFQLLAKYILKIKC